MPMPMPARWCAASRVSSAWRRQASAQASMGVLFVGVPGRLLRIMRPVIDFHDDGFLVRDRGAVHIALRIAVEASRREDDLSRGVFVFTLQAEHELVRRMMMRLRNAGALVELDE